MQHANKPSNPIIRGNTSVALGEASDRRFYPSEFSTYFGGKAFDDIRSCCVDDSGFIYLFGETESDNLPVVNALQSQLSGPSDLFLAKLSCDGSRIVFCTYLGGGGYEHAIDMVLCKRSLCFLAYGSADYPITSDAMQKDYLGRGVLTRFDLQGNLLYSTRIEGNIGSWVDLSTLTIDGLENVYIAAVTYRSVPFITADAFRKTKNSPDAMPLPDGLILKLNPTCDSILYASYFGGSAANFMGDIKIDRGKNIIVAGETESIDFPLKNELPVISNGDDGFISKLDSTGTRLVFSTLFGGRRRDGIWSMCVGEDNSVYAAGLTRSPDIPLKNPFQSVFYTDADAFVVRLDEEGKLLYSTYIGGLGSEADSYLERIALDRRHNIVISGRTDWLSPEFPLVNAMQAIRDSLPCSSGYVCILDSAGRNMLLSTLWGIDHIGGTGGVDCRTVRITKDDYLYISGYASKDVLLTASALQDQCGGGYDGFISKIHLDYLRRGELETRIVSPDSIVVETIHGKVTPDSFAIAFLLRNNSSRSMEDITGELLLPAGITLDPPTQDSRKSPLKTTLLPGDTTSLAWTVRADTTLRKDTLSSIGARIWYADSTAQPGCSLTFSGADIGVPVHATMETYSVQCALTLPDSLSPGEGMSGYADNPFTVSCRVRNTAPRSAQLGKALLMLPEGFETVPPGGYGKQLPFLQSGDTVRMTWIVRAAGARWRRDTAIAVAVLDSMGMEWTRCSKPIVVPKLTQELACVREVRDTLRFDPGAGGYVPNPCVIRFQIENRMYFEQKNVRAAIDFTRAPRLRLAGGELPTKVYASFGPDRTEYFNWSVEVAEAPASTVTDTVRMQFSSDDDTTRRVCTAFVVIEKPDPARLLSCALSLPDTVRVSGDSLAANPIRVSVSLKNIGPFQIGLKSIALQPFGDPRISSLDPPAVAASPLASGDTLSASWRLMLKSSAFYREHPVRILISDSGGTVLRTCESLVVVEPIVPSLSCGLAAVDTLHFNAALSRYEPDPFALLLTLSNKLDTIRTGIEAAIDLASAPHLALVDAGTQTQSLPPLDPRASGNARWDLRVLHPADQAASDTIVTRHRISPAGEWLPCRHVVAIEPEQKIARAECTAAGPDTIWNVKQKERLAPDPILVRYTLTNTGTMTLGGCSVAILPPGAFSVAAGTDSIQSIGPVPAGESVTREWWLKVIQPAPVDTSLLIRWQWSCAELTGDSGCAHAVYFTTLDAPSLILSPWVVRFRAKRNDPLPPARTVSLLTPVNSPFAWQAQTALPWLDVQPASGSLDAVVSLRPNTTSLPAGLHTGTLLFAPASSYPASRVQVEYDLYTLAAAGNEADAQGFALDQNFPNPFAAETSILFRIAARSRVLLKLFDLFGREVATLIDEEREPGSHLLQIRADRVRLMAGVYYYTLSANGRTVSRKMAVVK